MMRATEEKPAVKLFMLKAKDMNEPPFFHANVPGTVLVAAKDKRQARNYAAAAKPAMLPNSFDSAWMSDDLVSCEEFDVAKHPGFVASA